MKGPDLVDSAAEQYWISAKEAEQHAERAQDVAAKRTWIEVAATYRELAVWAEHYQDGSTATNAQRPRYATD